MEVGDGSEGQGPAQSPWKVVLLIVSAEVLQRCLICLGVSGRPIVSGEAGRGGTDAK